MRNAAIAGAALTLLALPSAAEIALSGRAEIGFGQAPGANGLRLHHDLDVTFSLIGETDGGLVFGATIELDEVLNGLGPGDGLTSGNPGKVFLSGDFGYLEMGDTDGAFDWAMREASWASTLADDHSAHAGFSGNSGFDDTDLDGKSAQVLRYEYARGDYAFALSADLGDRDTLGIGFKYGLDIGATTLILGIGAQSGEHVFNAPSIAEPANTQIRLAGRGEVYGASLEASFGNGFSVILNHSKLDAVFDRATSTLTIAPFTVTPVSGLDVPLEWTHTGAGLAYQNGGLLIEANYGEYDATLLGVPIAADGFGLALNYDLGWGARVALGYGAGRAFHLATQPSPGRDESWSAGLLLDF